MSGLLHVGVTGTRHGVRGPQLRGLADVIDHLRPDVLHHGDCVGADVIAASLARSAGARIIGHPPEDDRYRAFYDSDEELEPKGYLARDRDIVLATRALIACPRRMHQELRSGTWATIRFCLSQLQYRPLYCIWPDGTVDYPRIGSAKLFLPNNELTTEERAWLKSQPG